MGYQDGPMSVAPKAITWDGVSLPPPVTPLPPNEDPAVHDNYDYERSALPAVSSLVPFFSAPKALLNDTGEVVIQTNKPEPSSTFPPKGTLPKLSSVGASPTIDAGAAVLGAIIAIAFISLTLESMGVAVAGGATLFGPIEQYQNMLTNPDNVPDGM